MVVGVTGASEPMITWQPTESTTFFLSFVGLNLFLYYENNFDS
jgi:hypothetical protein